MDLGVVNGPTGFVMHTHIGNHVICVLFFREGLPPMLNFLFHASSYLPPYSSLHQHTGKYTGGHHSHSPSVSSAAFVLGQLLLYIRARVRQWTKLCILLIAVLSNTWHAVPPPRRRYCTVCCYQPCDERPFQASPMNMHMSYLPPGKVIATGRGQSEDFHAQRQ